MTYVQDDNLCIFLKIFNSLTQNVVIQIESHKSKHNDLYNNNSNIDMT